MLSRFALVLGLGLALAGCGGGGSSSGASPALPPAATPSPSAAAGVTSSTLSCVRSAPGVTVPPVAPVVATGKVLDVDSGQPQAGVTVALAPWSHGAAPVASTVTDAGGNFALGVSAPGQYLLVVGSDGAGDGCATLHVAVTLQNGSNTLSAPAPLSPPPANVSYTSAQSSGALRIATLTSEEQSCIVETNRGRARNSLPPLIEDELALENVRGFHQEELAQQSDTPSPMYQNNSFAIFLFAFPAGTYVMHSGQNYLGCAGWTSPDSSVSEWGDPNNTSGPSHVPSFDPTNVWIGSTSSGYGPNSMYAAQLWERDPRP